MKKTNNENIGKKYNSLTIKSLFICKRRSRTIAICKCDCGKISEHILKNIKNGHTKSCGCLVIKTNTSHGLSNSLTYSSWSHMIKRCDGKNNDRPNYNKISVDKKWLSFENFFADMGKRPKGKSIDRIDNNKGYFKENCRWADVKTQANNTSRNKKIIYNGSEITISEAAKKTGLHYNSIIYRLKTSGGDLKLIFRGKHVRKKSIN